MVVTVLGDDDVVDAWTRAGAAALCGRADGPPLAAPARLVPQLASVASTIASVSGRLGRRVVLVNFTSEAADVIVDGRWQVEVDSDGLLEGEGYPGRLAGDAAVLLRPCVE